MDTGSGGLRLQAGRLEAVRLDSEALVQRCQQVLARVRTTRGQVRRCRSQRQKERDSVATWRQPGPGCIPVMEQAKGIVMAQQGCRPDEAFDLLHRASRRAGVRVHVLAAEMVKHLAASQDGSNVTPISLGAIGCLR